MIPLTEFLLCIEWTYTTVDIAGKSVLAVYMSCKGRELQIVDLIQAEGNVLDMAAQMRGLCNIQQVLERSFNKPYV